MREEEVINTFIDWCVAIPVVLWLGRVEFFFFVLVHQPVS